MQIIIRGIIPTFRLKFVGPSRRVAPKTAGTYRPSAHMIIIERCNLTATFSRVSSSSLVEPEPNCGLSRSPLTSRCRSSVRRAVVRPLSKYPNPLASPSNATRSHRGCTSRTPRASMRLALRMHQTNAARSNRRQRFCTRVVHYLLYLPTEESVCLSGQNSKHSAYTLLTTNLLYIR